MASVPTFPSNTLFLKPSQYYKLRKNCSSTNGKNFGDKCEKQLENFVENNVSIRASTKCTPEEKPNMKMGKPKTERTALQMREQIEDFKKNLQTSIINTPTPKLKRAFLLSTVIRERDGQIEFRKKDQEFFANVEKKYVSQVADSVRQEQSETISKEIKAKEANLKRAEFIRNQMEVKRIRDSEHKKEVLEHGAMVRNLDNLFMEDFSKQLIARNKDKLELLEEQTAFLHLCRKAKEEEDDIERKEWKKLAEYEKLKTEELEKRLTTLNDIHKTRQQRVENAYQLSKQLKDNRKEICILAMEKVDDKREEKKIEDCCKRRIAAREEFLKHYETAMLEKRNKKERLKDQRTKEFEDNQTQATEYNMQCKNRRIQEFAKKKEIQKELLQQIEEKRIWSEKSKQNQLKNDNAELKKLEGEDNKFIESAKDMIRELESRGYNTVPVIRATSGYTKKEQLTKSGPIQAKSSEPSAVHHRKPFV